ncbi:hypothetical protein QQ045_020554 [Rhodiola kirilowii]
MRAVREGVQVRREGSLTYSQRERNDELEIAVVERAAAASAAAGGSSEMNDEHDNPHNQENVIPQGFSSWKNTERLASHVGDVNSFHNQALKKSDDLMRQAQSIIVALHKQSDSTKNEHRIRLNVSIDVSRFLLQQGLPFRGHDESEESNNQGNFMEMVKYTANQNETANKVVLKKAPGNN